MQDGLQSYGRMAFLGAIANKKWPMGPPGEEKIFSLNLCLSVCLSVFVSAVPKCWKICWHVFDIEVTDCKLLLSFRSFPIFHFYTRVGCCVISYEAKRLWKIKGCPAGLFNSFTAPASGRKLFGQWKWIRIHVISHSRLGYGRGKVILAWKFRLFSRLLRVKIVSHAFELVWPWLFLFPQVVLSSSCCIIVQKDKTKHLTIIFSFATKARWLMDLSLKSVLAAALRDRAGANCTKLNHSYTVRDLWHLLDLWNLLDLWYL